MDVIRNSGGGFQIKTTEPRDSDSKLGVVEQRAHLSELFKDDIRFLIKFLVPDVLNHEGCLRTGKCRNSFVINVTQTDSGIHLFGWVAPERLIDLGIILLNNH